MRVLVTGGAGFIGSHIVDAVIADGHEPVVIDDFSSGSRENLPSDVPIFEADIRDRERILKIFADVKPNRVSHQAAQMSVSRSVREPGFDAEVNVLGLINVLDGCVSCGAERIVFASSGGVLYGDVSSPAPETTPSKPISPYGFTKMMGEIYLDFYAKEHGLEAVALRYSNVYGPRQNPHGEAGVVAIFCKLLLQGKTPRINGDGKYIRDYVFGPDVAAANLKSLTSDLPQRFNAYNIGTAVATDVNQLAGKLRETAQGILRENGRDTVIPEPEHGPPRAGDLRSSLVDSSKIENELGWRSQVSIDEGLHKTASWFWEHAQSSGD